MSGNETPTTREDFFTLIHKGLRQMLFDTTTRAGTLDWDGRAAVDGFAAQWGELHHLLRIHAKHEDEHFFPLLGERAPEIVARVHAEHHELEAELAQLADPRRVHGEHGTEDGALSRRVMLSAMSPGERLLLLTTVRRTAPVPAFEAVLDEARSLLEPDQWAPARGHLESVEPEDRADTA